MDKKDILLSLQRFRSLFAYLSECPDKLLKELAVLLPVKHMIFPCDIIDLRYFFIEDKILSPNPIPLFSQRFADKYLKNYSIFLVLDSTKINVDKYRYGGLQLNFCEELNISNFLTRIIVNEPASIGSFDIVKDIVKEFDIGVECLVSNSIPGISSPTPRLSNVKKKLKVGQIINSNSEFSLTPKEQNIFDFLKTVKKDYNLNIQMRVCGGWVRDKLLGKDSDDIDIAVDMPGYDFAQLVAEAAVRNNITHDPKAYRVSLEKSADPDEKGLDDKLMVGAVYLFGQKIEFVPMRTEYYPDPNSRQPEITTTKDPREDVKRRDLTINALYYNIDTGEIDDFVGGKNDLGIGRDGPIVLKTPDESYKIFYEDPLRLLRVLRFHSYYPDSIIDDSIIESMRNPAIQESYTKKVATERAGPEIMKMMRGDNPTDSLKLLFDSGLYKMVFKVPEMENINSEGIHMEQQTLYHKYNLLDHTINVVKNLNQIMKDEGENEYMRGLNNIAALFHDFGKMKKDIQRPHPKNEGQMQYISHERDSVRMADQILKSIGVGKDDRDMVNQIIKLHMRAHSAKDWGPKGKGRFLRDTKMHGKEEEHKDLWKYIFYHARADEMSSQPDKYNPKEHQEVFENFKKFVEGPLGLFKGTIVNGHDVMDIFSIHAPLLQPSTGYIKEVLERIKEFQDNGTIDMSFVTMPDGDEKGNVLKNAKEQAITLIKDMVPEITNKYKEPLMSKNWFKKMKLSQVIPSGETGQKNDPEIIKGPKKAIPQYYRGMRIRDRRKGMANPQEYGKVENIQDDKMKIIWNPNDKKRRKEEIFDTIEDTEILSLIIAEV